MDVRIVEESKGCGRVYGRCKGMWKRVEGCNYKVEGSGRGEE